MFSMMMLSRKVPKRVLVQAFTTRSNGAATRPFQHLSTAANQGIFRQFSSARGVAQQVDEDLDATLDSLLGEAFAEAEAPKKAHMKDSHPVPPKLVETVSRSILC